ncbi:endo alpha-1,4 polygalactosaminidase [Flavobacterium sp.]|uniref:endo alpha-1,4 polygalactosaminidase n=1 Tax=Flavobacterium sp. TaxID=239 RepID=UPI0037504E5A
MKKYLFLSVIIFLFGCSNDFNNDSVVVDLTHRNEMRNFVIGISSYAKAINPNFAIIPQNGIELVTENGEIDGQLSTTYLNAIDGNGQEDLFYGYDTDDVATSNEDSNYLNNFLQLSNNSGNKILSTDYCSTQSKMTSSYIKNNNLGYISFAANQRNLNVIPNFPSSIYHENTNVITNLNQAQNFLHLINAENFTTKSQFINAVIATNYDALIMDLYFKDGTAFTASEVLQLKNKANGGKRIVISYMSIGEAESYRYYWQSSWNGSNKPNFLDAENPSWAGNFKVKYWIPEWQNIIYGNDTSYLKKILNAGFDGVYLDIIDAFEYYEN